jgi:hypothetical protein
MPICPQDLHLCHLPDCRTAGCERTGEPPLAECVECGTVFVRALGRAVRFDVCADCLGGSRPAAHFRSAVHSKE